MNVRRYIDYAVKREVKRVLFRDSLLQNINELIAICNKDEKNLGQARPSLKVLKNIVEQPKNMSLEKIEENKKHFAKNIIKAVSKGAASVFGKLAENKAKQIFDLINKSSVVSGSSIPTSGDRPYRTVAQQSLGNYIPESEYKYGPPKNLTLQEKENARIISQKTGLPIDDVIRQMLKNKR